MSNLYDLHPSNQPRKVVLEASGLPSGLLAVIGVVLVILKLAGVINWAWWIVLIPFWLPLAVLLAILLVLLVLAFVTYIATGAVDRIKR